MFLAWNYTLELFFWIIACAILLVSITIFFASPRFRSKQTSESNETLSLSGQVKGSSKEKVVNQNRTSSSPEKELEIIEKRNKEIEEEKLPFFIRLRNYLPLIAHILYSYWIIGYGLLSVLLNFSYSSSLNVVATLVGGGLCLSGLISVYGFLTNKEELIRNTCRISATLFLIVVILSELKGETKLFSLVNLVKVLIPLFVSGDLKRVWRNLSSNKNEETEKDNKEETEKDSKEETSSYVELKATAVIFSYSLFSLLIFFIWLTWDSHIETDPREFDKIFSLLLKNLLLINGFILYYGFYQNNATLLTISGRVVAFIFFSGHEDMVMSSPFETSTFFLFGFFALIFTGDLKRVLELLNASNNKSQS